jgi:ParB family chromosome partitioning protein
MSRVAVSTILLANVICPKQVRERPNPEMLDELGCSLLEVGQLQPIRVRPHGDNFVVIIGSRRVEAARKAGFQYIDAILENRELDDAEVIRQQLIENTHREELRPLEKARAIESLMREAGWSASEVAAKLGLSPGTVSKLLGILALPKELQERIGSPGLGLTAAYQISLAGNAEAQVRLADQLASGAITRDGAAELTRSRRKTRVSKRKRSSNTRDRVVVPLGGGRSVVVAGPELTLDSLIELIATFLDRVKGVHSRGLALPEAIKLLTLQA